MNIYKYMSFEQFISMVEMKKLHLTRIDCWEDVYEGYFIKELFKERLLLLEFSPKQLDLLKTCLLRCLYAQSWCSQDGESDAMWRIYSSNNNGVRIKFSQETIQKNIQGIDRREIKVEPLFKIDYEDKIPVAKKIKSTDLLDNITYPLKYKRTAFKHEAEYRFAAYFPAEITYVQKLVKSNDAKILNKDLIQAFTDSKERTISYNIDIESLEEVLLDPRAADYQEEIFKEYCQNRNFGGLGIDFKKSELYTL